MVHRLLRGSGLGRAFLLTFFLLPPTMSRQGAVQMKPNWMHYDDATDAAKEAAWRAVAGEQAPHRAWYYSFRFRDETVPPEMLPTLCGVFWDADGKRRV